MLTALQLSPYESTHFNLIMQIRTATTNDSEEMHRIHTSAVLTTCKPFYTNVQIDSWLSGRSPEGYHEAINKGDMYVAQEDGAVVGFGHAVPGEVVAVFVDPEFHKKGIGQLLLNHGLEIALKGHNKVRIESTVNAQSFYERHGFVKVRDDVCIKRGVPMPVVILEYLA